VKPGFLRKLLHDLAVTALAGLLLTAGLALVLLLAGLLLKGFDFRSALVIVRGGLLIAGAMELFVSAGLLLRSKSGEKVQDSSQWKRFFQLFGLFPVLILTAGVVLTAASMLDIYLYF